MDIQVLRDQAEAQYKKVEEMDFVLAMKSDSSGYNQFRLIYDRPGEFGTYLYPANKDVDRKNLYREFENKANLLFQTKMEEYETDSAITREDKDNLFRDAWSRGHANGYSEVWHFYGVGLEKYDRYAKGEINRDEFEDYLEI
jgi:hypothetical protein